MEVDYEKYTNQMWVIPQEVRLVREKEQWFIYFLYGNYRIRLDRVQGEILAREFYEQQRYESRKFRRSLRFKWERYWYMRRWRKTHG